MTNADAQDRWRSAEARLDALRAVLDSLVSTLVMRGVLNRAELEHILQSSEAVLRAKDPHPAALEQLAAIREDIPEHMRAALGPAPDEDDHDH